MNEVGFSRYIEIGLSRGTHYSNYITKQNMASA